MEQVILCRIRAIGAAAYMISGGIAGGSSSIAVDLASAASMIIGVVMPIDAVCMVLGATTLIGGVIGLALTAVTMYYLYEVLDQMYMYYILGDYEAGQQLIGEAMIGIACMVAGPVIGKIFEALGIDTGTILGRVMKWLDDVGNGIAARLLGLGFSQKSIMEIAETKGVVGLEAVAEAFEKISSLLDDYATAVRTGTKYGSEFKPVVSSAAIDTTNPSIVGYGCNGIWQNNPSIVSKSFGSIDEYVAFYRNTLTDAYIDEMVAANPAQFTEKNISEIKTEMGKLRGLIQNTKDMAGDFGFTGPAGEASFEGRWLVENCAEVWAVRDAILKGAKLENIAIRSVETATGAVKEFCDNCVNTFAYLIKAN